MASTLYTSTDLDSDQRQVLQNDTVKSIFYYDSSGETWDKSGSANQSWYTEIYTPHDGFDTSTISSDRWNVVDDSPISTPTIDQDSGLLTVGVERDEGTSGLSSDGKWRLAGDFDIRLYIDWGSYYNEYRSIAHTFLKVGFDSENAARLAFEFDGSSSFSFVSEKVVDRSLVFFDWQDNGSGVTTTFAAATAYTIFKITRTSGVIRMYISTGTTDIQVGDDLTDSVFGEDLFVELGVETKEYNTYRSAFNKFFIFSGTTTPTQEFFSPTRGRRQDFPDKTILAVDNESLSIIDEGAGSLWARITLGSESPVPNSTTKVAACNGVVYCTTPDGLVAFDFGQDRMYLYKDSSIFVADEPIALRNASPTFRTYLSSVGTLPDNNLHDVACRTVGSEDYIAFTTDAGVSVRRALASGVSNSSDGPVPANLVEISERGSLYWSGYDSDDNVGELSYYTNIAALAGGGTSTFNRTDYYGADTTLSLFGNNINAIDVRSVSGADQIAVGSEEGLSFIAVSPGAPGTASFSYGVSSPASSPFNDPSFEQPLGLAWTPVVVGFQEKFKVLRSSEYVTDGQNYSLKLGFNDPANTAYFQAGTLVGVYQDVDLTGVEAVYFDLKIEDNAFALGDGWNFEVVVGEDILKSIPNQDATFERLNTAVLVSEYEGVHRFYFQLRFDADIQAFGLSDNPVWVDNVRVEIGDPDYRVLPAGNANISEVLLQYDSVGHKIYFSTAGGFGAVDLDDHSLDYFTPITNFLENDPEILSAEFSRVVEDV